MAEPEFTTETLPAEIRRAKGCLRRISDGRKVEPRQCPTCGQTFYAANSPSRTGLGKYCSRSCGNRQTSKRHGHCTNGISPTYNTWVSMRTRCDYPSSCKFATYGARGISYPQSWRKFENFLADMGERPPGKTLDRCDSAKSYSKENCRWATPQEQQRHLKNNINVTHNGITRCLREWSLETGINYGVLRRRLSQGWPVELALTVKPTPANRALSKAITAVAIPSSTTCRNF